MATTGISVDKKIDVLKKALKDSMKKNTDMEEELAKLKEDVVIKQEQIDKLKEELQKFRDNSGKKQLQRFITGFFDNEKPENEGEAEQKEIESNRIRELEQEKEELQKKLTKVEEEKEFVDNKLTESIQNISNIKKEYDIQVENLKKEYDNKLQSIKEESENTIAQLQKELFEKNKTLNDQATSIKGMSELCKSFDVQKFDYEKQINTYKTENEENKATVEKKTKEIEKLLANQVKILQQMEDKNDEVSVLKDQIKQYKSIIEDLTPFSKDYLFRGVLIPSNKDKEGKRKNVEISFGKYKNSMYFKEEGEKEIIFVPKEIAGIFKDKRSKNRLFFCLLINGEQKTYLYEFTRKEVEYILRFYSEINGKKNTYVENALMNVSLGDYFY